jgi:hypothetical protein
VANVVKKANEPAVVLDGEAKALGEPIVQAWFVYVDHRNRVSPSFASSGIGHSDGPVARSRFRPQERRLIPWILRLTHAVPLSGDAPLSLIQA